MSESHELTEAEARFLIKRSLAKVPASVLRDVHHGVQAKRDIAAHIAVEAIMAQLKVSGHRIVRGPEVKGH